ncbi:MAG: ParA family protein [Thiotrichales bacterium]|jgi:chromosome partitioning protein|nr:ParA family protein [Thiotrichales bacterium]MBT3614071.1 ParA family protein [Thiotrichales bacterium]MBT4260870.1 ParA family protein [Thiotrichales bacterium]MBT5290528.1 ParA family protein [Thiotrichales bacterium]MBT5417827.1 ParA family protein [Thiotrichales bacterium]
MRRVAVVNQKGGVGKTTLTSNLAHALALAGRRVLLLDMDPQSQLATTFGLFERGMSGMDEILLAGDSIEQHAHLVRDNLNIVPAGSRLGELEIGECITEIKQQERGKLLKEALDNSEIESDFVLIDAPPSSGILVINILYAVDEVVIPVTGDYLGLQGLSYMVGTLQNFEISLEHKLKQWMVMSRINRRRKVSKDVIGKVKEYFPEQLLNTTVRECDALAEAPGFGQTVFEYRKNSSGARDMQRVADDLLKVNINE